MKTTLKLEQLGLLLLFTATYFYLYPVQWGLYVTLFFVPDVSFISYLINKKIATLAYNIMHHQGIMALVVMAGYALHYTIFTHIGLIFLAHSTFDRVMGYGLKYPDSFDHTHLGWIGKSKHKNS